MRGCIAFFVFALVVAPALCAFETLAAASTFIVNRDFYSDILAAPEVYNALLDGVVSEAAGVEDQLRRTGEYDQIAAALNSAEWRAAMQSLVDQVFGVIEGESDRITLNIPLAPLKALLESSAGEAFVRSYAQNLPDCRTGQEPTDTPSTIAGLPLPICVPGNVTRAEYIDGLVGRLPSIAQNMPANLTYSNTFFVDESVRGFAGVGVQEALTTAVIVLGVIALGSWFVNGLIGADRPKGRLLVLGISLFIPSLFALMIGVGIAMALNNPDVLAVRFESDDSVARAVYTSIFGGINTVATSFLAAGGIPAAIGLALAFFGFILPSRREDPMLDLMRNPTTQYGGSPGNYSVYDKPKNEPKPKNDGDIIKPL